MTLDPKKIAELKELYEELHSYEKTVIIKGATIKTSPGPQSPEGERINWIYNRIEYILWEDILPEIIK